MTGWDAHFEGGEHALAQLDDLIEQLVESTHESERLDDLQPVELATAGEAAWERVDTDGVDLSVQTDRRVNADSDRLGTLLERLFRSAVVHGEAWHVTLGELGDGSGFYVEDDGVGVGARREVAFRRGVTTVDSRAGLGIAMCAPIADRHGWSLSTTEGHAGGTRVELSGVEMNSAQP